MCPAVGCPLDRRVSPVRGKGTAVTSSGYSSASGSKCAAVLSARGTLADNRASGLTQTNMATDNTTSIQILPRRTLDVGTHTSVACGRTIERFADRRRTGSPRQPGHSTCASQHGDSLAARGRTAPANVGVARGRDGRAVRRPPCGRTARTAAFRQRTEVGVIPRPHDFTEG